MAFTQYSIRVDTEKTARAQGDELHISPRHCVEICRALRGRPITEAKTYLEAIINKKQAVPFKRHNSGVGHRTGMTGWDAGRYPQKAAREILKVLKHAEANAEYKGLDADQMRVLYSLARSGRTIQGRMPRAMGRATAKNTETVIIEMTLQELTDGD